MPLHESKIKTNWFLRGLSLVSTALCVLFLSTGLANATVATPTATGNATARVVLPLNIAVTNPSLKFGVLIPTGVNGTVTISSTSPIGQPIRTLSNVDTIPTDPNDTISTARFDVWGEPGQDFNVTFPSSFVINDGAGHSMNVDTFATYSVPGGAATANIISLPGDGGPVNVRVGATLHVDANQAAGDYQANFNVTVAYQ